MSMVILLYIVVLVASAVALLGVAVTSFATTSVVDRVLAAFFAVCAAGNAWHLIATGAGRGVVFIPAFFVPFYAGYKLYRGFQHREERRADREANKRALATADDWRASRRW
ncbi:hypothetical protein V6U81_04500 [Micromonospora sp. CPCC 205711]|uniref:hypothetical protein n=1 Tax=Micromonospora sp. CPCC 205547 TaxID=3122400 RepID=UPI002FF18AC2